MTRKQEAILALIVVIAAIGAFVLYSGVFRSPEPAPEPEPAHEPEPAPEPAPPLIDYINDHVEWYDTLDETYLEAFEEGDFDLANPYIVINPYGSAPLTALIMFETEEPARITVSVIGKTADTSVTHTFDEYETTHIIPVYGLYPDMANFVELVAEPSSHSSQKTLTSRLLLQTWGVPEGFPTNLILRHIDHQQEQGPAFSDPLTPEDAITLEDAIPEDENPASDLPLQQPPEFFFTFVRKSAFDQNGDYRWYYNGFGTIYPTSYTDDENFLMIVGSFEEENALLLELNMLGRIVSVTPVDDERGIGGNGAHHLELRPLYAGG